MNNVTIIYDEEFYLSTESTTDEMWTLGRFLTREIGICPVNAASFKEWVLPNKNNTDEIIDGLSCTTTYLEKDGRGNIYLTDNIGGGPENLECPPTTIKMTKQQFIQLLDDWHEKVYKLRPQKVTIIYDNNDYIIKTKN